MTLRLVPEAAEDLRQLRYSGKQHQIVKKLRMIEQAPTQVGQPLGKGLTNFRKVVVGDRNWRIIYRVEPSDDPDVVPDAVIWVVGDRADDACYKTARERLQRLGEHPDAPAAIRGIDLLLAARKERRELEGS